MGCCGGGNGWTGEANNWPVEPGRRYQWEVIFAGGERLVYDTDTEAYAAVASSGGGVRRIDAA